MCASNDDSYLILVGCVRRGERVCVAECGREYGNNDQKDVDDGTKVSQKGCAELELRGQTSVLIWSPWPYVSMGAAPQHK